MAKKVKKHAEKYAYMREGEKYKPGATRPRPGRMFNKKQYQKAKKVIACKRCLRLGHGVARHGFRNDARADRRMASGGNHGCSLEGENLRLCFVLRLLVGRPDDVTMCVQMQRICTCRGKWHLCVHAQCCVRACQRVVVRVRARVKVLRLTYHQECVSTAC